MTISVVCPSCATKLRAPENMAGRKTKCPKCGTAVVVPDPEKPVAGATRAAPEEQISTAVARSVPPARRPRETDPRIDDLPPAHDSETSGSQRGLWIGLAICGTFGVLIAIGVTLWATGFLNGSAAQRGDSQAHAPVAQPTVPKAEPVTEQLPPKQELPYDLKGDRLGMSLQEFKDKYRQTTRVRTKTYVEPFTSDLRSDAERENEPHLEFFEEPWHPKAKIVNAVLGEIFQPDLKPSLAEIKTSSHVYRFIDERLYGIELFFPQSGFTRVKLAMLETYGTPKSSVSNEYQNAFGAKFTGDVLTWDNGMSRIVLTERERKLDRSHLNFIHHDLYKEVLVRWSQFGKPKKL